ncbi:MAG: sigma-70 family RNA polymerase sigma factor [Pseudomonadota bacterium]
MPLDQQTQIDLADAIVRCGTGDRAAFKRVYDITASKLFSIVANMVKDDALAEDILQQAFVTIWKTADRYDPGRGKAFTWILVITRNKSLDALRARARQNTCAEVPDTVADTAPLPDQTVDRILLGDILRAHLAQLPERFSSAVVLNVVEGWTSTEIADHLGVSRNTVKSWVRRGLEKLREDLPFDGREAAL